MDAEAVIDGPKAAVQGPEGPAAVAPDQERAEVRSAASLGMMESLVSGALPVGDASAPGNTRSILAPVLFSSAQPPNDAAPASTQALSDRELVVEVDKPASKASVARRKPSFFDISDDPASRERLLNAAPAPFDPHVPSLPARAGSDPKVDPDSGLLDIRRLIKLDVDPKKKKKAENRADDDIFRLTGGLFTPGASGPLIAPDMNALIAPVVPEAGRKRESTRPAAEATAKAPERAVGLTSGHSERPRLPAAMAASRQSTRAAWAVGITVVGVGLVLVALKLSKPDETATAPPPGSAAPPPSALETVAAAPPPVVAPPVVAPPPIAPSTIALADPGAPVKREKDPVVAIPTTAAPRSTSPTSPVVAPPVVTAAPVVVAPPPATGGAEFNRSAAIAALNAAAGRAASCKQADDPSGGAVVSVTFAPSGRVTSSKVTTPPFQGTPTGGCIASAFRAATVPPFEGAPVSVTKNVSIH